jgi:hypothetical protein
MHQINLNSYLLKYVYVVLVGSKYKNNLIIVGNLSYRTCLNLNFLNEFDKNFFI